MSIGGWLSSPAAERVRVRRSTVVLFTAFVALVAIYLGVRDEPVVQGPVVVVPTSSTD